MNLGRNVICSYKLAAFCKARPWKNREVWPDKFCGQDDFYYVGRNNHIRRVDMAGKRILAQLWENVEGFGPMPTVYQRVVRRLK
jgi:hypothetical protein